MRVVKLYYAKIGNMGDLLNELIIENVLGYKVIHYPKRFTCQSTGIGSFLGSFFPKKTDLPLSKKVAGRVLDCLKSDLQIWSSGFMYYPSNEEEVPIRKNIKVSCVRGELTRKRLEKSLGIKLNVPTGDGGLLASYLITGKIQKKYKVGIIPHFRERDEERFKELWRNYNNAIMIDLTEEPLSVVKKISQCEFILSSALHGLIVADSFGIPNVRLICTNKPLGDGYKFDDYYSSFGITVKPFDLNKHGYPSLDSIAENYKISYKDVENKKKLLIESFSKYL